MWTRSETLDWSEHVVSRQSANGFNRAYVAFSTQRCSTYFMSIIPAHYMSSFRCYVGDQVGLCVLVPTNTTSTAA